MDILILIIIHIIISLLLLINHHTLHHQKNIYTYDVFIIISVITTNCTNTHQLAKYYPPFQGYSLPPYLHIWGDKGNFHPDLLGKIQGSIVHDR